MTVTYWTQNSIEQPGKFSNATEESTWAAFESVRTCHSHSKLDYTAQQLADAQLADGYSALHEAAAQGKLLVIQDGATPQMLLETKYGASRGTEYFDESALALAIKAGQLAEVQDGVTSKMLSDALTRDGASLLYLAAKHGALDQIYGGVTADELVTQVGNNKMSALYWAITNQQLRCIKNLTLQHLRDDLVASSASEGCWSLQHFFARRCLTELPHSAEQLAGIQAYADQSSMLHVAASYGCLDQVMGGVTSAQLSAVKNNQGESALLSAAFCGHLHQLKDRPSIPQLAADRPSGLFQKSGLASTYKTEQLAWTLGSNPRDDWQQLTSVEKREIRALLAKEHEHPVEPWFFDLIFSGEAENPMWLPDALMPALGVACAKADYAKVRSWFEAKQVAALLTKRPLNSVFEEQPVRRWLHRCMLKYPEVIRIARSFGFEFTDLHYYIFLDQCNFKAVPTQGGYALELATQAPARFFTQRDKNYLQDSINLQVAKHGHNATLIEQLVLYCRPFIKLTNTVFFPARCKHPFLNYGIEKGVPFRSPILQVGDFALLYHRTEGLEKGEQYRRWFVVAPRLNGIGYNQCWDCSPDQLHPVVCSRTCVTDFEFL